MEVGVRPIELALILGIIVEAKATLGRVSIQFVDGNEDGAPNVHFVGWRMNNTVQTRICVVDIVPMWHNAVDCFVVVDELLKVLC